MIGRFLELSVETRDIRASIEFYERLGFSQCETGDTWPHPYGVVTDGRLVIGLHEYRFPSPSITCVRAGIAGHVGEFERAGIELAFRRTGDDMFHEIGCRDPGGHMVTVLEARTFSPCTRSRDEPSHCGDFLHYSLPAADTAASVALWERCGFVATEALDIPYAHQPLTSDHLDLALHAPRFSREPLLVFRHAAPGELRDTLEAAGLRFAATPPGSLDTAQHLLIEPPEGPALLIVPAG